MKRVLSVLLLVILVIFVAAANADPELYNNPIPAKTAKTNVNIRQKTDKNSKRLAQILKAGTEMTILGEENDKNGTLWYYVRTQKGTEGYVRNDMVEIVETEVVTPEPTPEPTLEPAPVSTPGPVTESEIVTETEAEAAADYTVTTTGLEQLAFYTPEPEQVQGTADESNWQDVYHDFIFGKKYKELYVGSDDGIETYHDSFGNAYQFGLYTYNSFGLHDMNGDNVPELFVCNKYDQNYGKRATVYVYTVKNGRLFSVGFIDDSFAETLEFFDSAEYPGVMFVGSEEGYFYAYYYSMTADNQLEWEAIIEQDYNDEDGTVQWSEEPLLIAKTSDDALYDTYSNARRESIFTHSESALNEYEWNTFLYLAEVDRFAYTVRDNDGAEDFAENEDGGYRETQTAGNPAYSGYYDIPANDYDRPIVYSTDDLAMAPKGWMDVHGNKIIGANYNIIPFSRGYYFLCGNYLSNSLVDIEYYLVGRDGTVVYTTRNRMKACWMPDENEYWYVESIEEAYRQIPQRIFNEKAQDITSEANLQKVNPVPSASPPEEEPLLYATDNFDGTFTVTNRSTSQSAIVRAYQLYERGYNYLVFNSGVGDKTFLVNCYFEQVPVSYQSSFIFLNPGEKIEKRVYTSEEPEYAQYLSGEVNDPNYGWLRTFKDIRCRDIDLTGKEGKDSIYSEAKYYKPEYVNVPMITLPASLLTQAEVGTIFGHLEFDGNGDYYGDIIVSKPRLPDALANLIKETHLNYFMVSLVQNSIPSVSATLYTISSNEDVMVEGKALTSEKSVNYFTVVTVNATKWSIQLLAQSGIYHPQSVSVLGSTEGDGITLASNLSWNVVYPEIPFTVSYDYMNLPDNIVSLLEEDIPNIHTIN